MYTANEPDQRLIHSRKTPSENRYNISPFSRNDKRTANRQLCLLRWNFPVLWTEYEYSSLRS